MIQTDMPGTLVADLSTVSEEEFAAGRDLFHRAFSEEEGLGPVFNQRRCSSCHDLPTLGGSGVEFPTKATRWSPQGGCSDLSPLGGAMIQSQHIGSVLSADETPAEANAVSRLNAPALFGAGLVELIDDEDLLAADDRYDADGDGISGRAIRTRNGRVGRFGLKSEHATIRSFVVDALNAELGLTTQERPRDPVANGVGPADRVPDPEVGDDIVRGLVMFVRGLAPIGPDPERIDGTFAEGQAVFHQIGCAACHTPTQTVADDVDGPLAGRSFPAYSDFLVHDMGSELTGHCSSGGEPTEWRTAPLAGLRFRHGLLHDGVFDRIERAILLHGGEAQATAEAYETLLQRDKESLLAFLEAL